MKISKHTLNRWRVTGEGPPYIKYGPRLVRYVESVLDEWAHQRLHGSTSEYGGNRRRQLHAFMVFGDRTHISIPCRPAFLGAHLRLRAR